MKKIITLVFLNCCFLFSAFSQTCPTGNGDDIGAAVSNGTNHQLYLEWPTAAEALTMRDALKEGAEQTAIEISGVVNQGTGNEDPISNTTLSKPETTIPGGNAFRIRSTVSVTDNNNGGLTGSIIFYYSAAAGGGSLECVYDNGEFQVPAPIQLVDLSAKSERKSVMISWQTAAEEENDYMAIERSTDGRNFSEIGKVEGAGTTTEMNNYMFEDSRPVNGVNYYRLRQVDFDGTENISYVVQATFQNESNGKPFSVYPTLMTNDSPLTIDLNSTSEGNITIEVLNINGQLLDSHFSNNTSNVQIPTADLENGIYFIRIVGSNTLSTQRFVKNK